MNQQANISDVPGLTNNWQMLESKEDKSANFIADWKLGKLECRFVRRCDDYFIVYLSSQSGCAQSCRFCHLTATKQVSQDCVDVEGFLEQAKVVLSYYDRVYPNNRAKSVHYNWMARGEPLSNSYLMDRSIQIISSLNSMAVYRELQPKFKISTIIPRDFNGGRLEDKFGSLPIDFYYSLYSVNPSFRKRWLPKAMPVKNGLELLSSWQKSTGRLVCLQWPFIQGENDSEEDVHSVIDEVQSAGLEVKFNLVRYNSFDAARGHESSQEIIERNFSIINSRLKNRTNRIVPRVGFDVKASCGMFVSE